MARKRASMREGPLAELFKRTEAAQRAQEEAPEGTDEPAVRGRVADERDRAVDDRRRQAALEETVEHVHDFVESPEPPQPRSRRLRPLEPPSEVVASRAAARYFEAMLEPAPRLHRVPTPKGAAYIASIRVVGVGGAGLNALHRMMDAGISQVDFIAVNTDVQALAISDAPVKIHIGEGVTQGLGSGADPEVGRRAAEEAADELPGDPPRLRHGLRDRGRRRRHRAPAPRRSSRASRASSERSRSGS